MTGTRFSLRAVQVVTTYAALARSLSTISARCVLRHRVEVRSVSLMLTVRLRREIFPGSFLRRGEAYQDFRSNGRNCARKNCRDDTVTTRK